MSHLDSLISSLKPSSTFMGRKPLSSSLAEGMQGKEKKKTWIHEITLGVISKKSWRFITSMFLWIDEPLGSRNSVVFFG